MARYIYEYDVKLFLSIRVEADRRGDADGAVQDIIDAMEGDQNFLDGFNEKAAPVRVVYTSLERDETDEDFIERRPVGERDE